MICDGYSHNATWNIRHKIENFQKQNNVRRSHWLGALAKQKGCSRQHRHQSFAGHKEICVIQRRVQSKLAKRGRQKNNINNKFSNLDHALQETRKQHTHTHKRKKKKDNYYFPGNVRISVLGIHADTNEDSDLIQEIKYIFRGAL